MGRRISAIITISITIYFSFTGCRQRRSTMQDQGLLQNYQLVSNWPQLPVGYAIGSPVGIGIDSSQHVFIFNRAGREWTELVPIPKVPISGKTILEIDGKTGTLVNSWGDHLFLMPHGLTVDAADNIWVTDVGLQQVFKFSHTGKLLMVLGEAGIAGNDSTHFDMPTGVAVGKDGSVYVSDGYGNSRVVKFSAEGKFLLEWGSKGSGKGAFDIPHAIELDDEGNVYVADRENRRIQVFNRKGKLLKVFAHESFGNLCSMVFDKKSRRIIAVDDLTSLAVLHSGSDVIVINTMGMSFKRFGRSGHYTGPVCWYHDVAIDAAGNIYVVDLLTNSIQKFEKVTDY